MQAIGQYQRMFMHSEYEFITLANGNDECKQKPCTTGSYPSMIMLEYKF